MRIFKVCKPASPCLKGLKWGHLQCTLLWYCRPDNRNHCQRRWGWGRCEGCESFPRQVLISPSGPSKANKHVTLAHANIAPTPQNMQEMPSLSLLREVCTGCSLLKILKHIPDSGLSWCQCVYTRLHAWTIKYHVEYQHCSRTQFWTCDLASTTQCTTSLAMAQPLSNGRNSMVLSIYQT